MSDQNPSDLKVLLTRYVEEQTPTTPPPFDDIDVRAGQQTRRRVATVVAVPVVLAATVVGAQLIGDSAQPEQGAQALLASSVPGASGGPGGSSVPGAPIERVVPGQVPTPSAASEVRGAVSTPSGASSAACVEPYALAALGHRAFAFDGTVTGSTAMRAPADGSGVLAGYQTVTFTVHEWFRGGDRPSATVDMMAAPKAGTVSSVKAASYGVGTRLLVSGEPRFGGDPMQAPVAWGCGFTRAHDQRTAGAWSMTLGTK